MKEKQHRPFKLEEWISTFYLRKGIVRPGDIDEQTISNLFGIILTYEDKRSFANEDKDFKLINVDSRIPKSLQREHFFHELCHILRHYGSQLIMPKPFIELQEYDSQRFTRYASIPYHMVIQYDLDNPFLIPELANDFKVSPELCRKRIERIKGQHLADSLYAPESGLRYIT